MRGVSDDKAIIVAGGSPAERWSETVRRSRAHPIPTKTQDGGFARPVSHNAGIADP